MKVSDNLLVSGNVTVSGNLSVTQIEGIQTINVLESQDLVIADHDGTLISGFRILNSASYVLEYRL